MEGSSIKDAIRAAIWRTKKQSIFPAEIHLDFNDDNICILAQYKGQQFNVGCAHKDQMTLALADQETIPYISIDTSEITSKKGMNTKKLGQHYVAWTHNYDDRRKEQ